MYDYGPSIVYIARINVFFIWYMEDMSSSYVRLDIRRKFS